MNETASCTSPKDEPESQIVAPFIYSPTRKRVFSEISEKKESGSREAEEEPPKSRRNLASPRSSSPPELLTETLDKETWQGFCDIESEPAYFSVILREMGVRGVTVREVFGMTPDLLEMLPQPIHGLILLFRYREFGNTDQGSDGPAHVWFANQLPAQNSCGTLAMINILMNTPEIDTGEHLKQFKEFTQDFTPFQRGEAFASFDYVKKIHNSFAKKMDILVHDKHLAHKVKRANFLRRQESVPKTPKSKSRKRRKSVDSAATEDSTEEIEQNAHHFIAFVPIGNEVWKLDGYDAQPSSMGTFDAANGETWLSNVSDTIAMLMAAGDDDYGVIAMSQSPLLSLRQRASIAINTLKCVETRLESLDPEWRSFISDEDAPPTPESLSIGDQLELHPVPHDIRVTIGEEQMLHLLNRRSQLLKELSQTAANIMLEVQEEAEQDQKAAQRRYDYGPLIKKWLEMLAENGYLEENLDRFMPATGKKK